MNPLLQLLAALQGPVIAQDQGVSLDFTKPMQQQTSDVPTQARIDFERKIAQSQINQQPIKLDNQPYQALQKSTTENIPKGQKLQEYQKNIESGMSPIEAAQKYFNQPGQIITQASPSGKIEMLDYFKWYPSNEAFSLDTANLLKNYGIGQKPMTTLEFGQALEKGGYATKTDEKGNPIYAKQIVGTEARSNRIRELVTSSEFQSLSPDQQQQVLMDSKYAHNTFLNPITKQIDINKVQTMQQNIPVAWEAAQKISTLLNNNVKPESIFAKMANETGYFTKPVANYNFSSVKIKNIDRLKLGNK